MKMVENIIQVKDYVTKSNLPASDFVINPYVGCPHACKYCYACFMKRFTGHKDPWGAFIDIKVCDIAINSKKLAGKSVFMASVTDCYNIFEEQYGITRKILEQLVFINCNLAISTKSKLILRDINLLKQCRKLKVAISLNTLDENFKNDMDKASSVKDRLSTLQELHLNGIYTVLFISPIFPELTDYKALLEQTHGYVDEYWFENLNLRGNYKQTILSYIQENYSDLYPLYEEIYVKGNSSYWLELGLQIESYCREHNIAHINYFFHKDLVKAKLERG